jgi:ferredoxin
LAPGHFLRITGEAREVSNDEVKEKAAAGSEIHRYALEEEARYSAMKLFCIFKGKGEVFDYDFEMENRDHKLLRKRFAFGGETVNDAGVRIDPDKCIACGECYEVCTFNAIVEGEPYKVNGEHCDECGKNSKRYTIVKLFSSFCTHYRFRQPPGRPVIRPLIS